MIRYLQELKEIEKFCETFKGNVINIYFQHGEKDEPWKAWYCYHPWYESHWEVLMGISKTCDMFGILSLDEDRDDLVECVTRIHSPNDLRTKELFETNLGIIQAIFAKAQGEIERMFLLLDEEEVYRLDEALNCYIQGCNYSAVAMSVSGIEFRLLSLMKSKRPNRDLEKRTLGELIGIYLAKKEEYGNVIPKKHEPLLELCNTYRIFSVHPKKEKITRSIATSIINMTFMFLLDKDLKLEPHEN